MQRARGQEEKQRRKKDILRSAMELFSLNAGSMPSVNEIAKRTNLAKGTIYLYFKTREEIYVELLIEKFNLWTDHIEQSISSKPVDTESVVNGICEYVQTDKDLLLLASTLHSILEKNITVEKHYQFKRSLFTNLKSSAKRICAYFPSLNTGSATMLLLKSYSTILGIWQVSSLPEPEKGTDQEKEYNELKIDYYSTIRSALLALWKGTLEPN